MSRNSAARSCCSLLFPSLSSSFCFPCLSHRFLCQSASGPLAGQHLPLSHWVSTSQRMLALSANYAVYLTTVTAVVRKISAHHFANPQQRKQHLNEYLLSTDDFKLTLQLQTTADENSYDTTKQRDATVVPNSME